MASSEHTSTLNRKRLRANVKRTRANVQERKKGDTPEAPPEEETTVASQADDAQRILSKPVKAGEKRRKKRWGRSTTQVALLGAILIGGIAAIIGLRYLAEMVGVN